MSTQTFGDESNWKHEPHTEHHVDDKFGKGTHTRNWKKNLDGTLETKNEEEKENDSEEKDEESDKSTEP